jgi:hypothetical protein
VIISASYIQLLVLILLFRTYASQFETKIPSKFPDDLEEACKLIERVVNAEICKRKRFGLEYGGMFQVNGPEGTSEMSWIPNVAAANCYSGAKENVGYHSDALSVDLCLITFNLINLHRSSLGPYPTIASLSLGN